MYTAFMLCIILGRSAKRKTQSRRHAEDHDTNNSKSGQGLNKQGSIHCKVATAEGTETTAMTAP